MPKKARRGVRPLYVRLLRAAGFAPVGFGLFSIFTLFFEPIDAVAVMRHNRTSPKNLHHQAAEREELLPPRLSTAFPSRTKPGATRKRPEVHADGADVPGQAMRRLERRGSTRVGAALVLRRQHRAASRASATKSGPVSRARPVGRRRGEPQPVAARLLPRGRRVDRADSTPRRPRHAEHRARVRGTRARRARRRAEHADRVAPFVLLTTERSRPPRGSTGAARGPRRTSMPHCGATPLPEAEGGPDGERSRPDHQGAGGRGRRWRVLDAIGGGRSVSAIDQRGRRWWQRWRWVAMVAVASGTRARPQASWPRARPRASRPPCRTKLVRSGAALRSPRVAARLGDHRPRPSPQATGPKSTANSRDAPSRDQVAAKRRVVVARTTASRSGSPRAHHGAAPRAPHRPLVRARAEDARSVHTDGDGANAHPR